MDALLNNKQVYPNKMKYLLLRLIDYSLSGLPVISKYAGNMAGFIDNTHFKHSLNYLCLS